MKYSSEFLCCGDVILLREQNYISRIGESSLDTLQVRLAPSINVSFSMYLFMVLNVLMLIVRNQDISLQALWRLNNRVFLNTSPRSSPFRALRHSSHPMVY